LTISRAYTDRQPDLTAELAGRTLRLNPATSCRAADLDPDQKTISIGRMGAWMKVERQVKVLIKNLAIFFPLPSKEFLLISFKIQVL
jgi:hypothetical protein